MLLVYNLHLLLCQYSFCWRKLISWVCQAAMKALQPAGSCYHSQVQSADKSTMTAPPSQFVCMHTCVHYVHTGVRARVCFPGLKTEICQWVRRLSAYLGFLQIPNNQWQDWENEVLERERELSAKVIHFGTDHRCNISQDKGSSV